MMPKSLLILFAIVITIGVPSICAADVDPQKVPEPATAVLLLGAAGVGAVVTRFKRLK